MRSSSLHLTKASPVLATLSGPVGVRSRLQLLRLAGTLQPLGLEARGGAYQEVFSNSAAQKSSLTSAVWYLGEAMARINRVEPHSAQSRISKAVRSLNQYSEETKGHTKSTELTCKALEKLAHSLKLRAALDHEAIQASPGREVLHETNGCISEYVAARLFAGADPHGTHAALSNDVPWIAKLYIAERCLRQKGERNISIDHDDPLSLVRAVKRNFAEDCSSSPLNGVAVGGTENTLSPLELAAVQYSAEPISSTTSLTKELTSHLFELLGLSSVQSFPAHVLHRFAFILYAALSDAPCLSSFVMTSALTESAEWNVIEKMAHGPVGWVTPKKFARKDLHAEFTGVNQISNKLIDVKTKESNSQHVLDALSPYAHHKAHATSPAVLYLSRAFPFKPFSDLFSFTKSHLHDRVTICHAGLLANITGRSDEALNILNKLEKHEGTLLDKCYATQTDIYRSRGELDKAERALKKSMALGNDEAMIYAKETQF